MDTRLFNLVSASGEILAENITGSELNATAAALRAQHGHEVGVFKAVPVMTGEPVEVVPADMAVLTSALTAVRDAETAQRTAIIRFQKANVADQAKIAADALKYAQESPAFRRSDGSLQFDALNKVLDALQNGLQPGFGQLRFVVGIVAYVKAAGRLPSFSKG